MTNSDLPEAAESEVSTAESSDGPSQPKPGASGWPPEPGPGPSHGWPMDKDGRPIYTS